MYTHEKQLEKFIEVQRMREAQARINLAELEQIGTITWFQFNSKAHLWGSNFTGFTRETKASFIVLAKLSIQ